MDSAALFGFDLNGLLTIAISPLKGFLTGNNLVGGIITQFVICVFWVLGIHGHAVLGPIIRPFWDQAILENAELFQNGMSAFDLPNLLPNNFINGMRKWVVLDQRLHWLFCLCSLVQTI